MSLQNLFRITAVTVLAMMLVGFSGCKKEKPEDPEDPGKPAAATKRYETVPYLKGNQKSGALDNLVYTDHDDTCNYYFFVLGHVKSAPLAYRPAIYYNGTTPITVGYSATNVTQTSISNSVTEAKEHSVSKSTSFANTNKMRTMVGVEGGPAFVKFKAELEYGHEWTTTEESGTTSSRSVSNTYETSSAKASEITDEISVTIGTNNEPTGLYRFSLFSTTDVYFVVVTDRAKTEIKDAQIIYCARPVQFWALDYEPDQGGTFGKTATGDLLKIPDITNVSLLPDIEECTHEWDTWIMSTAATVKTEGEEYRTCKLCGKTQTRVIPVLRTGTFDIGSGTWVSGTGNATFNSSTKTLTVNDQAQIIITGSSTTNSIEVNGKAYITLKNASIDLTSSAKSPILLNSGSNLLLRLEGSNTLKASASYAAGIQTTGAELTITGPGSLVAIGGNSNSYFYGSGAGIGGSGAIFAAGMAGGTVTIESGTITANGGKATSGVPMYGSASGSGAGIGGAGGAGAFEGSIGEKGGAGGNITIYYGANVTANGGPATTFTTATGGGAGASLGGGGGGGKAAQGDHGNIDDQR